MNFVVKLFHLLPCKMRPEVEYLFNENYFYYAVSIIFYYSHFLHLFFFFLCVCVFFFFFMIYLGVAGEKAWWFQVSVALGEDPSSL